MFVIHILLRSLKLLTVCCHLLWDNIVLAYVECKSEECAEENQDQEEVTKWLTRTIKKLHSMSNIDIKDVVAHIKAE